MSGLTVEELESRAFVRGYTEIEKALFEHLFQLERELEDLKEAFDELERDFESSVMQ